MKKRKFEIGDFVRHTGSGEYGFISDFDIPEMYRVKNIKHGGGVSFWAEASIEKTDKTKYEIEVEILNFVFRGQQSIKNGTGQLIKLGITKKEAEYLAREAYRGGKARRFKDRIAGGNHDK